jgi:hypothetical protein
LRVEVTRFMILSYVTVVTWGDAAADTRALTHACAARPLHRWGQPDSMLLRYLIEGHLMENGANPLRIMCVQEENFSNGGSLSHASSK